ncbi:MAG TPA: GNAT family protein [Oscillospiraceae bacterium]|nr:GNAT family protein [Oscillospiraceae bacterium]HRW57341.1 GNAT family protein [Oscillospiraceae bacterium]
MTRGGEIGILTEESGFHLPERLETERLILRRWGTGDLEDFYRYAKDPEVGPKAGWKPHASMEESAAKLAEFISGEEVLAIVLKESGKAVGSIGLHPDKKRAGGDIREIGYVLAQECWGRGLMPEAVRAVTDWAFREGGLTMLTVYHFPENLASGRVIEKCGFRYEGTLRRAWKIWDGSARDERCFSLTKEEYLGNP